MKYFYKYTFFWLGSVVLWSRCVFCLQSFDPVNTLNDLLALDCRYILPVSVLWFLLLRPVSPCIVAWWLIGNYIPRLSGCHRMNRLHSILPFLSIQFLFGFFLTVLALKLVVVLFSINSIYSFIAFFPLPPPLENNRFTMFFCRLFR